MTKSYDIIPPGTLVELADQYTEREPDVVVEMRGGDVARVLSVRGLCIEIQWPDDLDENGVPAAVRYLDEPAR